MAWTNLVSYPDPLSTLQGRSGNETRTNPEECRKSRGRLVQLVQLNDQSGHPRYPELIDQGLEGTNEGCSFDLSHWGTLRHTEGPQGGVNHLMARYMHRPDLCMSRGGWVWEEGFTLVPDSLVDHYPPTVTCHNITSYLFSSLRCTSTHPRMLTCFKAYSSLQAKNVSGLFGFAKLGI